MLLCILMLSCAKDDNGNSNNDNLTIEDVVNSGGSLAVETTSTNITSSTVSDDLEIDNTFWYCKSETVEFGVNPGGNSGFGLFNPNASIIYPGALLQGKTIGNPTPDEINVKQGGGTVTITNNGGYTLTNVEMEEINLTSMNDAMNQIIASAIDESVELSANFEYNLHKIYSEEQLSATLGFNYDSPTTEVSGSMSYNSNESFNQILVTLKQEFYTMAFDHTSDVNDFFDESVTVDELETWIQPNNPGCFVSSVTYGRLFYMLFTSTSSHYDMEAAINAKFDGVVTSGNVNAGVSLSSELSELTINVQAYGGGIGALTAATGEPDLSGLSDMFIETSTISTGRPISYVVKEIAFPQKVVSTKLNTSYTATNCQPYGQGFPPFARNWSQINQVGGGPVTAIFSVGRDLFAFTDGGTKMVFMNEDKPILDEGGIDGLFGMDGNGSYLSDHLSSVGAIDYFNFNGKNNSSSFIAYETNGGKGVLVSPYTAAPWTFQTITGLPEGADKPLSNFISGIGAVSNYRDAPGWNQTQENHSLFFSKDGDNCSYHVFNAVILSPLWIGTRYFHFNSTNDWSNQVYESFLNEGGVGAATFLEYGGEWYHIVVNGEGTKYMVRVAGSNPQNAWSGPFPF